MNRAKIAAVLSSNLFLLGSCTGITWVSLPVMKHIGGNSMARGETPSPEMMVIVSIPDLAVPGVRKLEAVRLERLAKFQSTHPDYTFVIPAGSGYDYRNGTSISYRATALSAGEVRVETDARHDDPFGSDVVGVYDATEREVRPIYTNRSIGLFAGFFGVAGASLLGLIGSILKKEGWIADCQGHQIRVTNSWTHGVKLYIDGVLRAENKSLLFANPRRPAISVTLSEAYASPKIEVFFTAILSVRAKIVVDGKKVAGDLD